MEKKCISCGSNLLEGSIQFQDDLGYDMWEYPCSSPDCGAILCVENELDE